MPRNLLQLIPKPTPDSINSGLSPLHQKTVMDYYGAPSTNKSKDCGDVTNRKLARMIVTESVHDNFRVTGHKQAVASLRAVLNAVKANDRELYDMIGSAGMLCCRLVRGSNTSWSNHAFGFAVDLTIGKKLDEQGDNMVYAGMLALYPYFHRFGWYWGAEFPTEDGMHFELADETFRTLVSRGLA